LFVALVLGVALRSEWVNLPMEVDAKTPETMTTQFLGTQMMERFVLPFEVVSVLLTAAMVGAIVIAMEEIIGRKSENRNPKSEGISEGAKQR